MTQFTGRARVLKTAAAHVGVVIALELRTRSLHR